MSADYERLREVEERLNGRISEVKGDLEKRLSETEDRLVKAIDKLEMKVDRLADSVNVLAREHMATKTKLGLMSAGVAFFVSLVGELGLHFLTK